MARIVVIQNTVSYPLAEKGSQLFKPCFRFLGVGARIVGVSFFEPPGTGIAVTGLVISHGFLLYCFSCGLVHIWLILGWANTSVNPYKAKMEGLLF